MEGVLLSPGARSSSSVMSVVLRPATAADEPFLREMLRLASNWREEEPERQPLAPGLSHYVTGFGRKGDIGIIAMADGEPAGAAWARRFRVQQAGYGFVAEDVPELAIGVRPQYRGGGIGGSLIAALKQALADAGYPRVSLSVEPDNPSHRIYRRAGFVRVADAGGAWTMVCDLASPNN
jgi:GNAT superfamily N-acetyltransferase